MAEHTRFLIVALGSLSYNRSRYCTYYVTEFFNDFFWILVLKIQEKNNTRVTNDVGQQSTPNGIMIFSVLLRKAILQYCKTAIIILISVQHVQMDMEEDSKLSLQSQKDSWNYRQGYGPRPLCERFHPKATRWRFPFLTANLQTGNCSFLRVKWQSQSEESDRKTN